MLNEYGRYFEGKSKAELDDIAKSFSFGEPQNPILFTPLLPCIPTHVWASENCKQRTRLNEILRKDSENTKKH